MTVLGKFAVFFISATVSVVSVALLSVAVLIALASIFVPKIDDMSGPGDVLMGGVIVLSIAGCLLPLGFWLGIVVFGFAMDKLGRFFPQSAEKPN